MPQVKYIGTCVKTDSISGAGLRWEPGQARQVTAELAERLLAFLDTWAAEKEQPAGRRGRDEPIGLAREEKPTEEPLPVIDFHAMDKNALVNFAEIKYGERLDRRQNEESIRHRVVALFSMHEMQE
jgi:hypothetical protein